MLDYFRTLKGAFGWKNKLGLKSLAIFALKSVLAYIFLVGLFLVGFRSVIYTPLMDYLTVAIIYDITSKGLLALKIIVAIPVIFHAIKTLVRGITAGIH